MAFLDISKAFDTINRDLMFIQLWKHGVQGKLGRLVKALYSRVDNMVIFGPFESEFYQVQSGVKQGCILSPCLFNLVMLDLEAELRLNFDCTTSADQVNALFYADDIVLIGKN